MAEWVQSQSQNQDTPCVGEHKKAFEGLKLSSLYAFCIFFLYYFMDTSKCQKFTWLNLYKNQYIYNEFENIKISKFLLIRVYL